MIPLFPDFAFINGRLNSSVLIVETSFFLSKVGLIRLSDKFLNRSPIKNSPQYLLNLILVITYTILHNLAYFPRKIICHSLFKVFFCWHWINYNMLGKRPVIAFKCNSIFNELAICFCIVFCIWNIAYYIIYYFFITRLCIVCIT